MTRTRTKSACHESAAREIMEREWAGKSLSDLHHALGKKIEDRPGVLFANDRRNDTDKRHFEGLSVNALPNMGCAERLQQIAAEAHERMGEERWQELNAEWENG